MCDASLTDVGNDAEGPLITVAKVPHVLCVQNKKLKFGKHARSIAWFNCHGHGQGGGEGFCWVAGRGDPGIAATVSLV